MIGPEKKYGSMIDQFIQKVEVNKVLARGLMKIVMRDEFATV